MASLMITPNKIKTPEITPCSSGLIEESSLGRELDKDISLHPTNCHISNVEQPNGLTLLMAPSCSSCYDTNIMDMAAKSGPACLCPVPVTGVTASSALVNRNYYHNTAGYHSQTNVTYYGSFLDLVDLRLLRIQLSWRLKGLGEILVPATAHTARHFRHTLQVTNILLSHYDAAVVPV